LPATPCFGSDLFFLVTIRVVAAIYCHFSASRHPLLRPPLQLTVFKFIRASTSAIFSEGLDRILPRIGHWSHRRSFRPIGAWSTLISLIYFFKRSLVGCGSGCLASRRFLPDHSLPLHRPTPTPRPFPYLTHSRGDVPIFSLFLLGRQKRPLLLNLFFCLSLNSCSFLLEFLASLLPEPRSSEFSRPAFFCRPAPLPLRPIAD